MSRDAGPEVEVRRIGVGWHVRVSGVIDERYDGRFVEKITEPGPIVMDLDRVGRISSFGVREWMEVLKRLPGDEYYFVNCRPVIVAQLNSVARFGGTGKVITFYCPYACPSCGNPFDVLVDMRRARDAVVAATPPAAACPSCGSNAEFDDLEDVYFGALAAQPPLALPFDVEAIVDGGTGASRPLRVSKVVEGEVTGLWLSGAIDARARLRRYAAELEGKVAVFLSGSVLTSPAGLERLRDVIAVEGADVFLVDVPLAIAGGLVDGNLTKNAKLVSVIGHARCPLCGASIPVPTTGEAEPRPCPGCNSTVTVGLAPSERALAARLPLSTPPADVAEFIHSQRAPWPTNTPPEGRRPSSALKAGSRIGRYEILRRIGMGGMAEVLLGCQSGPEGFRKKVVIKRILPHLAVQEKFVQMFLQEARLAARLSHSNIVQIHDLGREGEDYFIVMEYVPGIDLNRMLKLTAALGQVVPEGLAARIVADVCGALHAAHHAARDDGQLAPILHRDVSPHNILVGLDGSVKLTDFGVAKAADSVSNTNSGLLKGKLIYMAPEQLRGDPPDVRFDVYAAALTLFVTLALRNPYQQPSEVESMKLILSGVVPDITTRRKDLSPALTALVKKALAADVRHRFQSSEELQLALERFMASEAPEMSSKVQLSQWLRGLLEAAHTRQLLANRAPAPVVQTESTVIVRTPEAAPAAASEDTEDKGSWDPWAMLEE